MAAVATKTKPKKSETKAAAKAYFDAIAARDIDAMVACWKPGTVDRMVGNADLDVPAGMREWVGALFAAVRDFSIEVRDMVVGGDKAAVRWAARGTFDVTAKIDGVAPTGASIEIEGFDMLTVADGKVVRNDAYINGLDLARQMGVLPPAGSGADRAMLAATNARIAGQAKVRELLN